MRRPLSVIYLARHGETAWTLSGQHTGRTDLALTDDGERQARQLGTRLRQLDLDSVLSSPLQRARRTCELAGLSLQCEIAPDLMEWDYGSYEGLRTADIRLQLPGWNIFRDGCPGGESPLDVKRRADRVVHRLKERSGKYADILERTFFTGVGSVLVGSRCGRRTVLDFGYRELECARL